MTRTTHVRCSLQITMAQVIAKQSVQSHHFSDITQSSCTRNEKSMFNGE